MQVSRSLISPPLPSAHSHSHPHPPLRALSGNGKWCVVPSRPVPIFPPHQNLADHPPRDVTAPSPPVSSAPAQRRTIAANTTTARARQEHSSCARTSPVSSSASASSRTPITSRPPSSFMIRTPTHTRARLHLPSQDRQEVKTSTLHIPRFIPVRPL